MITLDDIRDYVAGLGIAEDSHCYCGKMPEKKEKSIGSYPLKSRPPNQIRQKLFLFWCIGTKYHPKVNRRQMLYNRHCKSAIM